MASNEYMNAMGVYILAFIMLGLVAIFGFLGAVSMEIAYRLKKVHAKFNRYFSGKEENDFYREFTNWDFVLWVVGLRSKEWMYGNADTEAKQASSIESAVSRRYESPSSPAVDEGRDSTSSEAQVLEEVGVHSCDVEEELSDKSETSKVN